MRYALEVMTRRNVLNAVAGASLAGAAPAASTSNAILELRWFRLRNGADDQARRTRAFLERGLAPALKRHGIGVTGFFESIIGPGSPFVLMVTSYPDFATYYRVTQRLLSAESSDEVLEKARGEYYSGGALGYVRMDVSLLRAFDGIPQVEVKAEADAKPRVFELRTYESNNFHTLKRKIRMFNEEEISIFRKTGINPVFFGETLVGTNMPNLTYLVAFDSLAGREQAWSRFVVDPAWLKLRAAPGYADAEIVSNISNSILRPLPFSTIR
ncbi:MAG: NIPSNAP family protein [Bryobacterales bacterium]|nr:NIPSNAP family protein [Bryobacterales bacterium]